MNATINKSSTNIQNMSTQITNIENAIENRRSENHAYEDHRTKTVVQNTMHTKTAAKTKCKLGNQSYKQWGRHVALATQMHGFI
jgi:outer membrane murein-binding lipoprotein Lpp